MQIKVACLIHPTLRRYRLVAEAMMAGINRCGDVAYAHPLHAKPMKHADVGVCYGWKNHARYVGYPQYVYADIGYWNRETSYRVTVGGWSPDPYVRAGLPASRLQSLGVTVKPWREGGDTIVIAGSTGKSCVEHGLAYREWEMAVAEKLRDCGKRVAYRPKPTDKFKSPISGIEYDDAPMQESMSRACALVTHHSNAAIEALVEGVPVHCTTGAAAAFSVPLNEIAQAPRLEGREQFLADVAWLNWRLDEMRSGACWSHMKERGLIKC